MSAAIVHDNTAEVLSAIREAGIRIDPRLPVECKQLFGNLGIRRHYCRANGLTIDQVGELLLDRGFILESPTEREVLEMLERLLTPGGRQRSETTAERSHDADMQHQADVRRKTRLRLYECAECSKKLRVADDHLQAEHIHVDPDTLAETRAPFILKTVQLESLPF